MKAVIMAGGEGTRLRPLTSTQPKPMIPVANRPLMEHVVELLARHGFDEIVVTVAFQADAIRAYFDDGHEFGVRLTYATENEPLGTAGSVRNAMDELDEPFLVVSGDVLTDIDLRAVVAFHEAHRGVATIALKAMENPVDFGVVIVDEVGAVERFVEKPTWGQVFSDTINTGIYVLDPDVFTAIPPDRPVDFSSEVFPQLLADGRGVFGYVADGYWEDVGTIDAYLRAHRDVLDGRTQLGIRGFSLGQGVYLGEGTEIDPSATLTGPLIVGDFCRVEAGAQLAPYTVLGSNVRVGADAFLERCVVHDNVYLGPQVRVRGSVVGRSVDLRRGARLDEGVVIGDESFVGRDAVIHPGVKVYPSKTIEHGAIVNSSIVWESRGARHLFGPLGVAGLANVDITPELVVRLAMAYATTRARGSTIVASRDTSRAARVLKRAVMVGLNASGVDVADLEVATVPVTRLEVRNERSAGGVTVRLAADDPQSVVIRFFDADGRDLSEADQRKVERLYYREDYRRSLAGEIGDITFPARSAELYTELLTGHVDLEAVRAARFKVVLDYAYGASSFVMPNVLSKLGADVLSLNPYASTRQALTFNRQAHAADLSHLVQASRAQLGAVIDSDGEHLTLVDDSGHVLTDAEGLTALVALVVAQPPGPAGDRAVALPVAVSHTVEALCQRAGAPVEWTSLSTSGVMEAASRPGVRFGGSLDGGYVFPDFLPAFDAVATLVRVLALLAADRRPLSAVLGSLPAPSVVRQEVPTPWERRGLVMRTVLEAAEPADVVLVDGVKVRYDDGWVLVRPDPELPVIHVWAEAPSVADARRRAADYVERISTSIKG